MHRIDLPITAFLLTFAMAHSAYGDSVVSEDWQPWDSLSEAEQKGIAPYCQGGFVARPLTLDENDNTTVQFDSGDYSSTDVAKFQGNVSVNTLQFNALAESVELNQSEQTGVLEGDVIVRIPEAAFSADSAQITLSTYYTLLKNAEFVLAQKDLHGQAEELERKNQHVFVTKNVSFTRCAPETIGWQLKSSKLTVDNEEQIATAWNSRLELANIPVLYIPYISFPLNNQARTGLLTPTFGNGVYQPYYFHLATNYDDTVAIEATGNSGWLVHNEFRFLTKDHNGINETSVKIPSQQIDPDSTIPQNRWSISHQQSGQLNTYLGYDINTRWVSDTKYDLDYTSGINKEIKEQQLDVTFKSKIQSYSSDLTFSYDEPIPNGEGNFRTLDITSKTKKGSTTATAIYQTQQLASDDTVTATDYDLLKVPSLVLTTTQSISLNTKLTATAGITQFSRELPSDVIAVLSGDDISLNTQTLRYNTQFKLNNSFSNNWGYISPTVEGFASFYSLDNAALSDEQFEHFAWRATFDQGLKLSKSVGDYQHSFEPRLHYTFAPLTDQAAAALDTTEETDYTLFSNSRFSGIDRIGDMQRLSGQFKYSWLDSTASKTYLEVKVDKGVQLSQERLTLTDVNDKIENWAPTYSDWLLSAEFTPNQQWTLSGALALEHNTFDQNTFGFGAHFQPTENIFGDLKIAKTEDNYTVKTGAYFPVFQNIALIGYLEAETPSSNGSIEWSSFKPTQVLAGIDYDNCCWNIRLAVLETAAAEDTDGQIDFLDDSNFEIKVELTLKGLGASAGNIEGLLKNLDFGYSGKLFNYR